MTRKFSEINRKRGTNPDGSKAERRKSHRYPVSVPIEVSWRVPDGQQNIKRDAIARQVNAQGGMLVMDVYPEVGSRVTLMNLISAETAEARVLATPSSREGVADGIIVELTAPSEQFWGVIFLSKKAGVELQKLEVSLRSSGIDLRLLNEFRDAVDYLRLSSAAVQEIRERQLQGREDAEVIQLLVVDRIRRAAAVCNELSVDFDSGKITPETKGVEEFARALDQLQTRVRVLLKGPERPNRPERVERVVPNERPFRNDRNDRNDRITERASERPAERVERPGPQPARKPNTLQHVNVK